MPASSWQMLLQGCAAALGLHQAVLRSHQNAALTAAAVAAALFAAAVALARAQQVAVLTVASAAFGKHLL